MSKRAWLFGLIGGLLIGCDPIEDLNVTVVVPAAAQAGFTSEAPGQVLLSFSDLGPTSIAVVCEPGEPLEIVQDRGGVGCSEERSVTAWIEPLRFPLDANSGEPIPCGVGSAVPEGSTALDLPPVDVPQASAILFEGNTRCQSDSETVTLTLE